MRVPILVVHGLNEGELVVLPESLGVPVVKDGKR